MGIVRGKIDDAKFLLVGKGPKEENLGDQVERMELADRVHCIGAVDHGKVLAFMNVPDLFILPSVEEIFGIVLVEAMSQGLPIDAMAVQGVPGIVREGVNGYLIRPGEEGMLAERIIFLLENRQIAKDIGERNREDSAQYRWDYLVNQYMDIYKGIYEESSY
jgi:glycosyltransferase involved in cell wall biosynthesis